MHKTYTVGAPYLAKTVEKSGAIKPEMEAGINKLHNINGNGPQHLKGTASMVVTKYDVMKLEMLFLFIFTFRKQ